MPTVDDQDDPFDAFMLPEARHQFSRGQNQKTTKPNTKKTMHEAQRLSTQEVPRNEASHASTCPSSTKKGSSNWPGRSRYFAQLEQDQEVELDEETQVNPTTIMANAGDVPGARLTAGPRDELAP